MKTSTKIEEQTKRKTNLRLVRTIRLAKKNKEWKSIADILSGSRKRWKNINLDLIEKKSKEGDIVIIPGKVLSQGEISKKIRVVAFAFSELAKEKLLKSKCEVLYLEEEIKKNPKAKGAKVLI